jgi:hypothetical protein
VTTLVNVVGFVLSAALAWMFGGVLRNSYLGGYEMAVFLSLGILSACSTLIFGSLLVSQAAQLWNDYLRFTPFQRSGSFNRQGITQRAANMTAQSITRPRLPQSNFGRRWSQRRTRSYEQIYVESYTYGEQRPYRLECRALNRRNLGLVGPHPRPILFVRQRRK